MFIKRLEIRNWIGIKELAFDPGKVNILSGKKGSGKTSTIEALEKAFTNKNNRAEVVRHGEEEATLLIQTDSGLEIERRIRPDRGDYLKIRKPGGAVPQTEAFLRKLINGDIFRPLEFVKKSPDEQAKIILNMLEIEWTKDNISAWFGEVPTVNYDAHILQVLKQIEQGYFEQRESVNREIRVLEAQVQGIKNDLPPNYDGDKWRAMKVQEYYSKIAEAEEVNKKILAARNIIEGLEERMATIAANAESDKQTIKSQQDRKRSDIREFKQFIAQKIEKNEEAVKQVDARIQQTEKELDNELQAEIQKLKEQYGQKKEAARHTIRSEVKELEKQTAEYRESLAAKDQEFANIDAMEEQIINSIDDTAKERIETENAKAGGAKTILNELQEIDTEPLTKNAEEVANMQSYLREWERMVDIIREKLAPRQESAKTLTAKIKKARELPMELLKTAAVPVPGITVDADGKIRIGETLIDGLSEGEQLELAFRVAKAQAGELKVICLDGINKINVSDRKWIEEDMETDEYQYFVLTTEDGDMQVKIGEAK